MRYYIINPVEGDVFKTDDTAVAEKVSLDDLVYVIDTEAEEIVAMSTIGERFKVEEYPDGDV